MSKDTPEVGDIFTRIYETKVSNRRVTSIYKCCDGDCLIHLAYLDEDNRISEEVIFLSTMNKHYKYLGHSKANINDLFKTEDNGKCIEDNTPHKESTVLFKTENEE